MASGVLKGSAVLLWTNSSPSSSFSNQTLQNISLSGYSFLMCEYAYTTGTTTLQSTIVENGNSARLTGFHIGSVSGGNANAFMAIRYMSPDISAGTIEFGSCTRSTITSGAASVDNAYCIPLKIYGIY